MVVWQASQALHLDWCCIKELFNVTQPCLLSKWKCSYCMCLWRKLQNARCHHPISCTCIAARGNRPSEGLGWIFTCSASRYLSSLPGRTFAMQSWFSPWAHYSAQVSGLLWVLQKEGLSSMSFHFWLVGWLSMRFENFSLKKKKPQWNISFYFFPVEKAYVTPSVMNFLMSRTSPHERRAEEK